MFLIGFCFNLIFTALYYTFAGMCYGIKRTVCKANNVSKLVVIPAMGIYQQCQTKTCTVSNKNNNISKKGTFITNGDSKENLDVNIQKHQSEVSSVNHPENYKLDTAVVSLRSMLTECMEKHDKTGRISKMFSDNI